MAELNCYSSSKHPDDGAVNEETTGEQL